MKRFLIFFGLIGLIFIMDSCNEKESLARKQLELKVNSESESTLKLGDFKKTNGYEQNALGLEFYVIEWTADVLTTRELWKISPDGFGAFYWSNFKTSTSNPDTWQGTWHFPYQHLDTGAKIRLVGQTLMQKTEKGWRTGEMKVTSSQVLNGLFVK